jgi:predicted nucleotidyltransferase
MSVLNEVVSTIKPILKDNLQKVILYGSYARGEATLDSDIDLLILVNSDSESCWDLFVNHISEHISDLELKHEEAINTLVRNYEMFQKQIEYNPLYKNIQKEGIILYEY